MSRSCICLLATTCIVATFAHAQDLDFNGDGVVDLSDANEAQNVDQLESLLSRLGQPRGDVDNDGWVQFGDFVALMDNYGSPGHYLDGDLTLDGQVGFEDWAIHATNFGRNSHRPPARVPAGAFSISVEPDSGNIVLTGDRTEISGIRLRSESSALIPGFIQDAGPFDIVLINSDQEIAYGTLTPGISILEEACCSLFHETVGVAETEFWVTG